MLKRKIILPESVLFDRTAHRLEPMDEPKSMSKNEFAKSKHSLIFLGESLFREVRKEVYKVFPKTILWRDLFVAVRKAEQEVKCSDLVLVAPREKQEREIPIESLPLSVSDIEGNLVLASIDLPLYGPSRQVNRVVEVLLRRLKLSSYFSPRNGGIGVDVRLPFVPRKTPHCIRPQEARVGQKVFICPRGFPKS